jgi:carboxymethylenebutenolidase
MSIQTRTVTIQTADGAMSAHLALPDGKGPHPAVIVIMEAFGLVKHILAVTERLAGEGYVAIAPDIYYRDAPDNKFGYDELPRALGLMQKVDDRKVVEDLRALIKSLRALPEVGSSKIGITGFCMGGRLSFLAATALGDEIAASAPFYGGGIVNHLPQASAIRAPLYLFFGGKDPYIPMAQVEQVDARLKELGKRYTLKTYANADHGFFCNERGSYSAEAASDAWSELKGFFAQHLR